MHDKSDKVKFTYIVSIYNLSSNQVHKRDISGNYLVKFERPNYRKLGFTQSRSLVSSPDMYGGFHFKRKCFKGLPLPRGYVTCLQISWGFCSKGFRGLSFQGWNVLASLGARALPFLDSCIILAIYLN